MTAAEPTPEVPMEPLPEFVHQGTGTHHLQAAIDSLRHAEEAASPRDKVQYLRRADEHILFARRHAESIAAYWRTYNERARAIGAFIHEDDVVTLDSEVLF